MEYEKFREKIVGLQHDLAEFKVEFLDRDGFKRFVDNLFNEVGAWTETCITGYFSEIIRQPLEQIVGRRGGSPRNVRLICQEFDLKKKRDRKNLEVLRKLEKAKIKIKINHRIHARFLVGYHPPTMPRTRWRGKLVIGSFDFNSECHSKERHDAGIITGHPDLVQSAVELFDQIWNDTESIVLSEKYPK